MAIGGVGGAGAAAAAAAAAAARRAAEAARKAAEAAAKRAAEAAAKKAAAAAAKAVAAKAAAAAKKQAPLHPRERATKNRSAFVENAKKTKAAEGPVRERATKNRSAYVAGKKLAEVAAGDAAKKIGADAGKKIAEIATADAAKKIGQEIAAGAAGKKIAELAGPEIAGGAAGKKIAELATSDAAKKIGQEIAAGAAGKKIAELAGAEDAAGAAGKKLAELATGDAAKKIGQEIAVGAAGKKIAELAGAEDAGGAAGKKLAELATGDAAKQIGQEIAAGAAGKKLAELAGPEIAGGAAGKKLAELATGDAAKQIGQEIAAGAAGKKLAELATGDAAKQIGQEIAAGAAGKKIAGLTGPEIAAGAAGKKLAELATGDAAKQLGQEIAAGAAGKKIAQLTGDGAFKFGQNAAAQITGADAARRLGGELGGTAAGKKLGELGAAEVARQAGQNVGRQLSGKQLADLGVGEAGNQLGEDFGSAAIENAVRRGLGGTGATVLSKTQTTAAKDKLAADKPKSPEEAGKQRGEERAKAIQARAEKELGKPLSQANPIDADKALTKAIKADTEHLPKDFIEKLPGKGTDAEKAKAFAKSYGDSQRETLKTALGPDNGGFALASGSGRALGASTAATVKEAAVASLGEKKAAGVTEAASKAAAPKPTALEVNFAVRVAQQANGNEAAITVLRDGLAANKDPGFQKSLLTQLTPLTEKWSDDLTDNEVTEGDVKSMKMLMAASREAGPEALKQLTRPLAEKWPENGEQAAKLSKELQLQGSSRDTGSVSLLRELGTQLDGLGKKDGASLAFDDVKYTLQGIRSNFEEKQEKLDKLQGRLNNYLGKLGPALSDDDRKALIKKFESREDYRNAKADVEKAAGPMANVTEEIGKSKLPTGDDSAAGEDLIKEEKAIAADQPKVGQTAAGKASIRRNLEAQADGEPAPLLDAIKNAKLGKEALTKTQAIFVQAISGGVLDAAKTGDFAQTKKLLDGLRHDAAIFGLSKDPAKFQTVVDDLEAVAKGEEGALGRLKTSTGELEGGASSSLKALGAVLSIAGNIDTYKDLGQAGVQKQLELVNDQLGLAGDAGALLIDTLGVEAKTLSAIFSGLNKFSGFFGGVLGFVQGVKDFTKGDEFKGVLGIGSATLAIAAAVGEVPVAGQVLAVVIIGAQVVKGLIDSHNEKEKLQAEFKDLLSVTELKNLDPDLIEEFTKDGDPGRFASYIATARASGQDPKEALLALNELTGDQKKILFERLDDVQGPEGKPLPAASPSDIALAKRREGPDAVLDEVDRQLNRPGLSDQQRQDLEKLKIFAEKAKIPGPAPVDESELLSGYPFQSHAGLAREFQDLGLLPGGSPPRAG